MKFFYRVTIKTADFHWGQQQRNAFEKDSKLICRNATLTNIEPKDTLIIDIIFAVEYVNWGIFIKLKGVHQYLPVGFYYKCFPLVENTYPLFKKIKSGHFMRHADPYTQSLPTIL